VGECCFSVDWDVMFRMKDVVEVADGVVEECCVDAFGAVIEDGVDCGAELNVHG